jgi:hypothetical protein
MIAFGDRVAAEDVLVGVLFPSDHGKSGPLALSVMPLLLALYWGVIWVENVD